MSANDIQHGGNHYKGKTIQPWDYIASNGIGYFEGTAIKYISRWKDKGGIEDLKKAIHFIEKLIEIEGEGKSSIDKVQNNKKKILLQYQYEGQLKIQWHEIYNYSGRTYGLFAIPMVHGLTRFKFSNKYTEDNFEIWVPYNEIYNES